eukprot:m.599967 g.599967  ORF g.599967 m.599967 type:complete len:64 (+) comp22428_c0_seq35:866-1057(+)
MVAVATLVAFLGFGGGNSYFCETPWVPNGEFPSSYNTRYGATCNCILPGGGFGVTVQCTMHLV